MIDERMLKQWLSKTSNWKAPGTDGRQVFCIKNLTALQARIAVQLNDTASSGETLEWMVTERMVLCMKNEPRGNVVDKYRPTTSLPVL